MEELKVRFDVGFSPIREALAKLAGEGLVELEPNKGFRVAALSRDDLADIAVTRSAIESVALHRSMQRGGTEWEVGIVAAMHRYRLTSKRAFDSENDLQEWEDAHEALHVALIAACEAPRLLTMQRQLQNQHMRYRRLIVLPQVSADAHVEEHEKLVGLTLARNIPEAVAAIHRHMMITVDVLDRAEVWKTADPAV